MNILLNNRQASIPLSPAQNIARYLLAAMMILAGIGHETFVRKEFQAQVPNWVPMDKDMVVILSGVAEITLALAYALWDRQRVLVGLTLALFFVLVFPGNLAQYFHHTDAFGLHSDLSRGLRLLFQPILVLWALWASGAIEALRK